MRVGPCPEGRIPPGPGCPAGRGRNEVRRLTAIAWYRSIQRQPAARLASNRFVQFSAGLAAQSSRETVDGEQRIAFGGCTLENRVMG